MPLRDVVEVRLQFDELTNLDLLRKGLYRVHASVRIAGVHASAAAVPFSCAAHPFRLTSVSRGFECPDSELGAEAGCIDDASYITRSVYMRYSDESFELGEEVSFRGEMPRSHTPKAQGGRHGGGGGGGGGVGKGRANEEEWWVVKLDLHRADCSFEELPHVGASSSSSSGGAPPPPNSHLSVEHGLAAQVGIVRRSVRRTGQFARVSTRTLAFPSSAVIGGLRAYIPVIFDSMNLAALGLTLHTCLVTTRFERPTAFVPNPPASVVGLVAAARRERSGSEGRSRRTSSAAAAAFSEAAGGDGGGGQAGADRGDVPVGTALLKWASTFRTAATAAEAVTSSGVLRATASGATSKLKAFAGKFTAGVASAATGLAAVLAPLPPSSSSAGALGASAGGGSGASDGAPPFPLPFPLPHESLYNPVDDEAGRLVVSLPADIRSFFAALAFYDSLPITLAEAACPSLHRAGYIERTARRTKLSAAVRLLEHTRVAGSFSDALSDADEDLKAAASAAASSAADTIASILHDIASQGGGSGGDPASPSPSSSPLPPAPPRAFPSVTEGEAQAAHLRLVGPLVDSLLVLHAWLDEASRLPADDGPLPLTDASYAPNRFGPSVRDREGNSGCSTTAEAAAAPARAAEILALLQKEFPSYGADGNPLPATSPSSSSAHQQTSAAEPAGGSDAGGTLPPHTLPLTDGARNPVGSPESFASRAHACLSRPEALGRALSWEIHAVSGEVYLAWQSVQREVALHKRGIDEVLQAQFRGRALRHVRSCVSRQSVHEVGLIDPRASQYTAAVVPPPALPSLLDAVMLDPATCVVPRVLRLTEVSAEGADERGAGGGGRGRPRGSSTSNSPARPLPLPNRVVGVGRNRRSSAGLAASAAGAGTAGGEGGGGEAGNAKLGTFAEPAITVKRPHLRMLNVAQGAGETLSSSSSFIFVPQDAAESAAGHHLTSPPTPPTAEASAAQRDMFSVKAIPSLAASSPEHEELEEQPQHHHHHHHHAYDEIVREHEADRPGQGPESADDTPGADSTGTRGTSETNGPVHPIGGARSTSIAEEGGAAADDQGGGNEEEEDVLGADDVLEDSTALGTFADVEYAPPGGLLLRPAGGGQGHTTTSSSSSSATGASLASRTQRTLSASSMTAGSGLAGGSIRTHVVVFLNGLGGSVHDTRVLRAHLKLHQPHLYLVVCSSNQGKLTEGDLVQAGVRIAQEVHDVLSNKLPDNGLALGALSFVGFSLGGIVARIAMRHPLLLPYVAGHAHAFISIATPHLGVMYSTSSMFSTGLFLIRKLRASAALTQLSLLDEAPAQAAAAAAAGGGGAGDLNSAAAGGGFLSSASSSTQGTGLLSPGPAVGVRASLLYLLAVGWQREAEEAGAGTLVPPSGGALHSLLRAGFSPVPNGALLNHFRHIVLLASPQDAYAPFASCMGQISPTALEDAKNGGAYTEMTRGFHRGLAPISKVKKVHVHFKEIGAGTESAPHNAQREEELHLPFAAGGSSLGGGDNGGAGGTAASGGGGGTASTPTLGGLKLSVDAVIGREAHVAFLESEQVAAAFSLAFDEVWTPGSEKWV